MSYSQQQYTLTFWAKAASARTIIVSAQEERTWVNLGLWQTPNLTTSWQQFIYTFTPGITTSNGQLSFNLGVSNPSVWIDGVELTTSLGKIAAPAEAAAVIPTSYALYQNHPNPFNPVTAFRFDLPEAVQVRLAVYNALGQKVATVIDGVRQSGAHSIRWDASRFSSGVYFYILEAGEKFRQTKKLLLMK